MAIAYKNPGDSLTADEWNQIFLVADAALTAYFGGLSPALAVHGFGFAKRFFLGFNPASAPAGIHPLAAAALATLSGVVQYNHAGILASVNALPVDAPVTLAGITKVAGGSGYHAPGQILVPVGGVGTAANIVVDAVDSNGSILTAHISYAGFYMVAPNLAANAVTSNGGTGAAFNLVLSDVAPQSDDFQIVRLQLSSSLNLDTCLSVVTRTINGKPYAVSLRNNQGTANGFAELIEETHPWDEVEVFVIGSFTFDATWNKYNLFRVHNLGSGTATLSFAGDHGIQIGPGQCRCVRRTGPGGIYTDGYNYAHKMLPGDPRVFALANASAFSSIIVFGPPVITSVTSGDVFNPLGCLALLTQQLNRNPDPTQFWDMSAPYASLLAPPALGSLIGDLLVVKGMFLAVRWMTQLGHSGGQLVGAPGATYYALVNPHLFGPGSNFQVGDVCAVIYDNNGGSPAMMTVTQVNGSGGVLAANFTNGAYYSPPAGNAEARPPRGGNPAIVNAAGSSPIVPPDSLCKATQIQFTGFAGIAAAFAQANPSFQGTTAGVSWSFNANTGMLTLTLNQDIGAIIDLVDVSTNLVTFLLNSTRYVSPGGTYATASGFLKTFTRAWRLVGSMATTAYHYLAYIFNGTYYQYGQQQTVNVNNAQVSVDSSDIVSTSFTFMDAVQKLADFLNTMANSQTAMSNIRVLLSPFGPALCWQESYPIGAGFSLNNIDLSTNFISAKMSGSALILQRAFLLARAFNSGFAPSVAGNSWLLPLLNSQPTHFPRKNRKYAVRQVTHNGADEPWQANNGSYQTSEPPRIKRFFESKPASTESTFGPGAAAAGTEMVPFSRPGPLAITGVGGFGDATGILLAQWLMAGATDFEKYLAAVGDAARGTGSVAGAALQLRLEVEHYNLLASQMNGLPTTTAKIQTVPPGLPTYSPSGVPSGVDINGIISYSNVFPRTCYYSWMAPASGDDPIADQMTALGLTVQMTVPDNYGIPLPLDGYAMDSLGNISNAVGGYANGFTPALQAAVLRYRWVSIDDARALYARFNIPFVLNSVTVPYQFKVVNVQGTVVPTINQGSTPNGTLLGPAGIYSEGTGGTIDGDTPVVMPLGGFRYAVRHGASIGPPYADTCVYAPTAGSSVGPTGGGYLGPANEIASGFVNSQTGHWLAPYASQPICSTSSPVAPIFEIEMDWAAAGGGSAEADYGQNIGSCSGPTETLIGGLLKYQFTAYGTYTYKQVTYATTFAQPANAGRPVPEQMAVGITSLCVILEGAQSQCVALIPKNYAHYDQSFAATNPAYAALGAQVIPVIADNTVENNPAEIQVLNGAGGAGAYEHVITTSLANATLLTFPVDN